MPHGTAASLWENKAVLCNETDNVKSEIVHPPQEVDNSWQDLDCEGSWWFIMVTKEEYNKLVDPEGNRITKIPGGLRCNHGGSYTMDGLSREPMPWAMWQKQLPAGNHAFGAKTVPPQCHQAHKPFIERTIGSEFSEQSPFTYRMDNVEMDTMRVLYIDYNLAVKFEDFSLNNGWGWIPGHTMHVTSVAQGPA